MRKNGRLLVSLMVVFFGATAGEAIAGVEGHPYREGEVIVKYRDGAIRTMDSMSTIYHRAGAVKVNRFHGALKNFEHMIFDTRAASVESVVADLQRDPAVEYVQPNYLLYASDTAAEATTLPGKDDRPALRPRPKDGPAVADPLLSQVWGLNRIGAPAAWKRSKGSRSVLVAVIDTGIDYNHPDLAANIWRNPNYGHQKATGVDATGTSGITGDLIGWDFVHDDNLPYDDVGHGTHVSGTIGAVGENGVGISGVTQKVSLMAVKFLGSDGSGDTASAIRGIDYAISRGAKVLNSSWGGKGSENAALKDALQRASDSGALVVVAAGNDATDNDSDPTYPASFNLPNMIAVAATDEQDNLALFSNTGARTVALAAPGVDIYSTLPGAKYGLLSGTSMAAPYVTGAAALVWAMHPGLTAAQVKARLLDSGDLLPSLQGKMLTGRRLNLARAVL